MNTRRIVRWMRALLISALLIPTAVLFVLYTPLTQNAIAQWAIAWLTQETGMEIKVKKVKLQFPLNIEMRDLHIDTLLSIGAIDADVHLRPLMRGIIRADYVSAKDITIHTQTLTDISAGRFRADKVSYHLQERRIHIHRMLIDESYSTLHNSSSTQPRDPGPNDFPLSISITDIQLQHIGVSYTDDTVAFSGWADHIALHDLAVDTAFQASLQSIAISDGAVMLKQNDMDSWILTHMAARVDSLQYSPSNFTGQLTHIAFKESHGINLQEGSMNIAWKNGLLSLPQFALYTDNSTIRGHLRTLDYNAKEKTIDGDAEIHIGYTDAQILAKWLSDIPQQFTRLYPSETLSASISLQGTMKQLQLNRCHVSLPTAFDVNMSGTMQITSPQDYIIRCHMEARSYDLDFLTAITKSNTLHIPSGLTYRGDLFYTPDTMHAQCLLILDRGTAFVEANYTPDNSVYELNLRTDSFDLQKIIPHKKLGLINLQAHAIGNSINYRDEGTSLRGTLQLHTLQWGDYTLTNASAQIAASNRILHAHVSYNDSQMQWSIATSAKYSPEAVEAIIDTQISNLDMLALHLTNNDIRPALKCHTTLHIDSGKVYDLRAYLTDITLTTPTQQIQPRPLSFQTMLTPDTALLTIRSGDLTLMANAHTEGLPWQWARKTSPRNFLTKMQATLVAGRDNPVSNYLSLMRINTDSINLSARYTDEKLYAHLQSGLFTWHNPEMKLQGKINASLVWGGNFTLDSLSGSIRLTDVQYALPTYNLQLHTMEPLSIPFNQERLIFTALPLYTAEEQPLWLNGSLAFSGNTPEVHLLLTTRETRLLPPKATRETLLYGNAIVSCDIALAGPFDALSITGNLDLCPSTSIHYIYKDAILTSGNQLGNVVTFTAFKADTLAAIPPKRRLSTNSFTMNLNITIDPTTQLGITLGANQQNRVSLQGGGMLNLQYVPAIGLRLAGKYTIETGNMNINVPFLHVSNMTIRQGSTITWSGSLQNPLFDIAAEERIRASVTLDGSPQVIAFIAGVSFTDTLEKLRLQFTLSSPENASMQNTLATLSPEERGKLAVALLTTGLYLGEGGTGNLMNTALMGILQSQIDNISRDAFRTVDVSVSIEPLPDGVSGVSTRTDYSFSIAKRLWDNRIRIIIGGSVTTDNERIKNNAIIDNISIEWRISPVGNQFLRFFYDKNSESILEGEIRETGVGYAYRKKF